MVAVQCSPEEPLRLRRLCPIESGGKQGIAEWHRDGTRHGNRVHTDSIYVNQSGSRKLRKRRELVKAVGAVRDAGIFAHILQRREKPQFALPQRATEGKHFVLAGKRLLGIWLGIIQWITSI